jgi:hypothetical protein
VLRANVSAYLKAAAAVVLPVAATWIVGYLGLHASSVLSGLQVDPLGAPVAVITPRAPWEFTAAMVAVSVAVAFVELLLLERFDPKGRVLVLAALLIVLIAGVIAGLSSGVLLEDSEFPLLLRAYLTGFASTFAYLLVGLVAAAILFLVRDDAVSRSRVHDEAL